MIASLILVLVLAACGGDDASNDSGSDLSTEASYSEQLEYTITGTEPGAGQTKQNEEALVTYESLAGWKQDLSSAGAMLTELSSAIENEEPIIFSAWSPHYKFANWDLKYLEDPMNVYGDEEEIRTIVRNGLIEEMPEAYTILDRIELELGDVEEALAEALESDYETVSQNWVDANGETVATWTDGVDTVDGTSIEIALLPWDDAYFTANVARVVLEQQGYDVTLTPVDPAIMFEAVGTGSADASMAVWMPTTHAPLYSENEDGFEDLGANLHGARTGLAVPAYMEIDSLEDLEPKE